MITHVNSMPRISIVGTGYVGLSTAVCFASRGYQVIATTQNEENVRKINAEQAPFHEPGLNDALRRCVRSKLLRAESSREKAVSETDMSFITVATPVQLDGTIDLRHVVRASEDIGGALSEKGAYHLVVVKSTVTPGTTREVLKPALERTSRLTAGRDFGLCANPEFLRQGSAIQDTLHPDRVVIGEHDRRSGKALEDVFNTFYERSVPILTMGLESAEMVKCASNAFLATKVSYANEVANICEQVLGVDVSQVMAAVGLDKRINPQFLNAGAGFGGSCLPKDLKVLCKFGEAHGYQAPLLRAVLAVNDGQARHIARLVLSILGKPNGKKVALLGLAFKPDTDDVRDAPSLKIAKLLIAAGARVCAFDPVVKASALQGFDALEHAHSISTCLAGAHCCVVVTEWEQFKALTPDDFVKHMVRPVLIDARRIFDPLQFRDRLTFNAVGLGNESLARSGQDRNRGDFQSDVPTR
jgi:UDPglucose 6-dehydrogenase